MGASIKEGLVLMLIARTSPANQSHFKSAFSISNASADVLKTGKFKKEKVSQAEQPLSLV
jgi:hypothetical protein